MRTRGNQGTVADEKDGKRRTPPSEAPTVALEGLVDRTTYDPHGFANGMGLEQEPTRLGSLDAPTRVPVGEPVTLKPLPSYTPATLPPQADPTIAASSEGDTVQAFRKEDLLALATGARPAIDSAPTKVPVPTIDLSTPAALPPVLVSPPVSLPRPEGPLLPKLEAPPPAAPPPPPPKVEPPKPPVVKAPIQDQSLFEGFESLRFKDDPDPPPAAPEPPLLDAGLLVEQAPKARPIDPADVRVVGAEAPASPYTTFDIPPALQVVLVPAPVVAAPPKPAPPAAPEPAVLAKLKLPGSGSGPTAPAPPPSAAPPAPRPRATSTTPRGGTPLEALDPVLPPEPKKEAPKKEPKKKKKEAERERASAPREGASNDELAGAVVTTDAVARMIPIVLMAFTVLAAIFVSIKLFSKDGPNPTHVQLRFLPIGKQEGPLVKPSMKPSRFEFETVPPGLLVLYNNEVLGRTPFTADLPIELAPSVAAEVSSPYYEAWVGELVKGTLGEYKISAVLKPK